MKKWFKFFSLSFFSNRISKDGMSRGYTNLFFGLILSFAFLWAGIVGGDMLTFGVHYNNSSDFVKTVHAVLANGDETQALDVEIIEGILKAKRHGEEYANALVISTLENEADRQVYAANGYDVVVDTRPADTLAEVEAYCISNDGKGLEITYEEYLTLSAVAKMNFDFHLKYTGNDLVLTDEMIATYKTYVVGLGDTQMQEVEALENSLAEESITKDQYNRSIYQLYFTNYYPDITDYEGTSKVPLLRNYYYHQYIQAGKSKYLFLFDDYMTASFETDRGMKYSFYGFYSEMENGTVMDADHFIKASYKAMTPITLYAHAMNIFTFIPFIALMPLVVALLAYSILRLRGVDSVKSFGSVVKIIGSYLWFSGAVSALLTMVLSFFVQPGAMIAISLVLFFITLAVRSILFSACEIKAYMKQVEQQGSQMEV